jgi:hypothetical protein
LGRFPSIIALSMLILLMSSFLVNEESYADAGNSTNLPPSDGEDRKIVLAYEIDDTNRGHTVLSLSLYDNMTGSPIRHVTFYILANEGSGTNDTGVTRHLIDATFYAPNGTLTLDLLHNPLLTFLSNSNESSEIMNATKEPINDAWISNSNQTIAVTNVAFSPNTNIVMHISIIGTDNIRNGYLPDKAPKMELVLNGGGVDRKDEVLLAPEFSSQIIIVLMVASLAG